MSKSLGNLEKKLMNVIWSSRKPLKAADVLEQLDSEYAYTTIMTLLTRLHEKGFLRRELVGKAYYYSAAKSKNAFADSMLKKMYKSFIADFGDLAIVKFVDAVKANPEELAKLKAFIEKSDEK